MADEFNLGGLRSALGLPKAKPSDSEPRGTSVSKPDQSRRDADALKVLQDELEKEQKLALKGNAVSARNVESLNREIARFGGKPAPASSLCISVFVCINAILFQLVLFFISLLPYFVFCILASVFLFSPFLSQALSPPSYSIHPQRLFLRYRMPCRERATFGLSADQS